MDTSFRRVTFLIACWISLASCSTGGHRETSSQGANETLANEVIGDGRIFVHTSDLKENAKLRLSIMGEGQPLVLAVAINNAIIACYERNRKCEVAEVTDPALESEDGDLATLKASVFLNEIGKDLLKYKIDKPVEKIFKEFPSAREIHNMIDSVKGKGSTTLRPVYVGIVELFYSPSENKYKVKVQGVFQKLDPAERPE